MKIGIDVAEVSRIRSAVEKNSRFLKKVFTKEEIEYFSKASLKWESIAGNFAVKEAYSKYLGTGIGDITFRDIVLCHNEKGAPYLMVRGKQANESVSISHSGNIAIAVVCGKGQSKTSHSETMKNLLPNRQRDAHKGMCGRVFILAGSKGMTGAAALSAMGALRSGTGLVTVGTADTEQGVLATKLTEAMTVGYKSSFGGIGLLDKEKIFGMAEKADAFVIGPGMGRLKETKELVLWLIQNVNKPMVIDADGLNALSGNIDILRGRKGQIVITPHEGEMALLCNKTAEEIKTQRENIAKEFAKTFGVVVALKGKDTVVTDGDKVFINPTGNPGMATGGSGDVLAGVLGSFIAQGLNIYDAAALGVYVHGLAGDIGVADKGELGLIASDIAENLPYAIKELSGE